MIIRDLIDSSITLVQKQKKKEELRVVVRAKINEIILQKLAGEKKKEDATSAFEDLLEKGALESQTIVIDVPLPAPKNKQPGIVGVGGVGGNIDLTDFMKTLQGGSKDKKESRKISLAEQSGIVFIDEIDKICSSGDYRGADASAEGVQRDMLPLIEGSIISTKHGNVNTDHILFVCSGAFHNCKPSDLLPELQGRLPIRVELQ